MPAANDDACVFDVFELDVRGRRLLCRDQDVLLAPKQYEVLHFLIRNHGKAVGINELLDACWGDANVGPNSVSNVIYALRSVFEKGGGSADWLQTVPRHGYRFAAPLRPPAAKEAADLPPPHHSEMASAGSLFVGRESELRQLALRWAQVTNGVPATVFVAGEAGIGKTTLVQQFCAMAAPPPRLCVGRCIPQHREAEPYMPVLEALGSLTDAGLAEIARDQAPTWLLQMPWLIPNDERAALSQALEGTKSSRMLREGKRLFAALARSTPLVLVLEDVHWADIATVDLIRALAESEHASRLLLIGTYRASDVVVRSHPLRDLVGALASQSRCQVLALGSLTPADVRNYLERRFSSVSLATDLAPRLEERSGGNPLFLDAMTTYLCDQQRIVRHDETWALASEAAGLVVDLPEGLREMIRTRLRNLGADSREVLEAAAAAGMDFTSLDVAAALAIDPIEAEERCEALTREGQFAHAVGEVRWPDGSHGASCRFAHAVYREALLGETPRSRQRVLHRRIGERLRQAFGNKARKIAPRLAVHFGLAGDIEQQIEYLGHSARLSMRRFAHQEAIAYLERVLEVLPHLPDDDSRAAREVGYQIERSRLLMDWKGYAASLESFTRVVDLAQRQGNSFLEFFGRVGCSLGQLMSGGQRADRAAEGTALLRIAANGHPELNALAHLLAGAERDAAGNLRDAVAHAEAALAALPTSMAGIPRGFDLETLIRILLQSSLGRLGYLERSRSERGLAIAGAEQRSTSGGKAHSFAFLAGDALIAGEPETALELADRAILNAREGDFEGYLTAGEALREAAHLAMCRDTAIEPVALDRLANAVKKRRQASELWVNGVLAGALADGYRRRGDLEVARQCIDHAFGDAGAVYAAEVWRIKGEIEAAAATVAKKTSERRQADAEASRCFHEATEISRGHGTKLFELRATTALARHCAGRDGSRDALAAAIESFPTATVTADMQAAAAMLAELPSRPRPAR